MSAKTRRNHKSWARSRQIRLLALPSAKKGGRYHRKYRVIARSARPPRRMEKGA